MQTISVSIKTSKGDIELALFSEECPKTVANFINLASRGYYNNLTFHRVINDFMIQGGCPNGDGRGGPGYNFEDEFSRDLLHNKPGILSMANAGPNTNGSQFFITHVATPWLNGRHTVFGEVTSPESQSVVDSITQGDKILQVIVNDTFSELLSAVHEVPFWNEVLDDRFDGLSPAQN